ncbi:hypothetical protein C0J52_16676 [Blattella germanica]|nr:hypothetical protein C0J52_16676 [Blattella germanica]
MDRYRKRWFQHVERMDDTRLPKLAFQYAPKRTEGCRKAKDEVEGDTVKTEHAAADSVKWRRRRRRRRRIVAMTYEITLVKF